MKIILMLICLVISGCVVGEPPPQWGERSIVAKIYTPATMTNGQFYKLLEEGCQVASCEAISKNDFTIDKELAALVDYSVWIRPDDSDTELAYIKKNHGEDTVTLTYSQRIPGPPTNQMNKLLHFIESYGVLVMVKNERVWHCKSELEFNRVSCSMNDHHYAVPITMSYALSASHLAEIKKNGWR
jgi:hypothetical protein